MRGHCTQAVVLPSVKLNAVGEFALSGRTVTKFFKYLMNDFIADSVLVFDESFKFKIRLYSCM